MDVKKLAAEVQDYLIEMRREFHRHPEPSMKEFETNKRIKEELDKMGVPWESVGDTLGIMGTLKGGKPGKTLMLRSDMDALEINEESGVEFASEKPGLMHACGHDAHMAILLATIKALVKVKDELPGTVKFLFQPSEENGLGGRLMVDNGVMEGIDGCFGMHVWSGVPVGKISVDPGPRMASCGFFTIHVKGKSGHGARPHEGIDAAVASAAILLNLQSIVSRETDPADTAVVTIGKVRIGDQRNIIAEDGYLEGTTRTFQPEVRARFEDTIRRIAVSTAEAYRCEAELDYYDIVAPTVNDPVCAERARKAVIKILGEDAVITFKPITVAEDMSAYMNIAPGCFAFVGVGNPEIGADWDHHNCHFKIDESGMINGVMLFLQYTEDWLNEFA